MSTTAAAPTAPARLESAALVTLCLLIGALQLSIAASALLLTLTVGLWMGLLITHRERLEVPAMFWPLVAYSSLTITSAAASLDPIASAADAKEILLFLIVPVVYRLARGRWAPTIATIIISVGAVTAMIGIVQYGILGYDSLGQRPLGSMGHYMTYSGLLMLVIGLTTARLLFGTVDRVWAGFVLPALLVALALTLTRSAWVGACVGIGLLFVIRDRRLLAVTPVIAAILFALAPQTVIDRAYSTFDLHDPTNRDRFAMARAGARMIRDNPLTGVGPDMVKEVYADYRDAGGVNETNPHLHNVPLQIAAERGLPALAAWIWFIVTATRELIACLRDPKSRALAAGGLAAMTSMIAAGMFEYNFGDSEFLMLLLVLLTLPIAARQASTARETTVVSSLSLSA
jgi:O-antigen ligase